MGTEFLITAYASTFFEKELLVLLKLNARGNETNVILEKNLLVQPCTTEIINRQLLGLGWVWPFSI